METYNWEEKENYSFEFITKNIKMEDKRFEIINKILKELDGQTVNECLDILDFIKTKINFSSILHHKVDL